MAAASDRVIEFVIEVRTLQNHTDDVWVPLNDGDSDFRFPTREMAESIIRKRIAPHQPNQTFRVRQL